MRLLRALGLLISSREKTVVRMGYGRSYDMGVFGSNFGHAVTQNLPVLGAQLAQNPNQFLPGFCSGSLDRRSSRSRPFLLMGSYRSLGRTVFVRGHVACVFSRTFDPLTQRLPYVDTWNAAVQHQLTKTMTLEVTYLGNKGTHGFVGDGPTYNVNQPRLGTGRITSGTPPSAFNKFSYPGLYGHID